MVPVFCQVDDKHIPLYRIMWIAAVPHFCGEDDCVREGQYEIRLEQEESVWASGNERDAVMQVLEQWQRGFESEQDWDE
tara:strand:- start:224 stop:460 length:237 start_codon:yes stop_codon:yes gene_type:complete